MTVSGVSENFWAQRLDAHRPARLIARTLMPQARQRGVISQRPHRESFVHEVNRPNKVSHGLFDRNILEYMCISSYIIPVCFFSGQESWSCFSLLRLLLCRLQSAVIPGRRSNTQQLSKARVLSSSEGNLKAPDISPLKRFQSSLCGSKI